MLHKKCPLSKDPHQAGLQPQDMQMQHMTQGAERGCVSCLNDNYLILDAPIKKFKYEEIPFYHRDLTLY